jgi:hypothetical protein
MSATNGRNQKGTPDDHQNHRADRGRSVIDRFLAGMLIIAVPWVLAFDLGLCWQPFRVGAGW